MPILFYIHLPEVSMFPHSFNLNIVILSYSWNSLFDGFRLGFFWAGPILPNHAGSFQLSLF